MISIKLEADAGIVASVADLCNTAQSHITLAVLQRHVFICAINPEYFKIYDTKQTAATEDFAIRLPQKVVKIIFSDICTLNIKIDAGIVFQMLQNDSVVMVVRVPYEQDFNSELITNVISDAVNASLIDLSALAEMKSLVAFADSGLQFKDNLAYIQGTGFILYHKMNHPIEFIMTRDNINELVRFAAAHDGIAVFESGIYTVFFGGNCFFGCKQPRYFIDSEYKSYLESECKLEAKCNLIELTKVLRAVSIPKGELPKCSFNLETNIASIDLGNSGRYDIAIGLAGADKVSGKYCKFQLSLDVIKKLFTSTALHYDNVTLYVYKTFVAFRIGGNDFLVNKE